MKKKSMGKAEARVLRLTGVYTANKQDAFTLAFVRLGSSKAVWDVLCRAFLAAGNRMARTPADPKAEKLLALESVARALPRKMPEPFCEGCTPDEAEFLKKIVGGLAPDARETWALTRVCGLTAAEAAAALGTKEAEAAETLSKAEATLGVLFQGDAAGAAERCRGIMARMSDRNEVLGTLTFLYERRTRASAWAQRASIGALAVAAAVVLVIEGGVIARRARFSGGYDESVVTADPASADYWRSTAYNVKSEEYPYAYDGLVRALEPLSDDQLVRVNFTYYDPNEMIGITEQNYNLESLYKSLYETGTEQTAVNTLTARAVCLYYANYVQPYLPELREKDSVSDYDSFYAAALAVPDTLSEANGKAARALIAARPDVFGSAESFEAYMYSDLFLDQAWQVNSLLITERYIRQYAAGTSDMTAEEYAQMREYYENALFAFSENYDKQFLTPGFAVTSAQLSWFRGLRASMASRLDDALFASCGGVLGTDCALSRDTVEFSDCSAYSANLSKATILRLAQSDKRFFFEGVAVAQKTGGNPSGLDAYTARVLALETKGRTKYDVYFIDENYEDYNVNYLVPVDLPQGFIDALRADLNSQYGDFERTAGFTYRTLYGHAASLTRTQILGKTLRRGGLTVTLADYKGDYTRLDPAQY